MRQRILSLMMISKRRLRSIDDVGTRQYLEVYKMADYKDMITGTLKNVFGKVKEAAASEQVQNIVDKVKDTADSVGVKNIVDKVKTAAENTGVRDIYEQGAGVAKAYGSIAKLSVELNGQREELKRVYAEIGELYFEQAKDAPEGVFAPLFAQAQQLTSDISAKETQISVLKAEVTPAAAEADIDVEITEFEEVVEATENEGSGTASDPDISE